MTNKIYRLADERNIGKEVFFSNVGLWHAIRTEQKTLLHYDEVAKLPYSIKNNCSWFFAFVEVTPADFSDEEIKTEYMKRPLLLPPSFGGAFGDSKLHANKEKTLTDFDANEIYLEIRKRLKTDEAKYFRELLGIKTLVDFSDNDIVSEFKARNLFAKNGLNAEHDKIINYLRAEAYELGRKEKTLADFSGDELKKEAIYKRNLVVFEKEEYTHVRNRLNRLSHEARKRDAAIKSIKDIPQSLIDEIANEWYEQGKYEGKREAAPKWISVDERLPDFIGSLLVKGVREGDVFVTTFDKTKDDYRDSNYFRCHKIYQITHWMPLPDAPEEQKPEQDLPKKCGKCNKNVVGLKRIYNLDDSYSIIFCSENCRDTFKNKKCQLCQKECSNNFVSGPSGIFCSWECYEKEKPEPKYTCAQCGMESPQLNYLYSQSAPGDKFFCREQCAKDYEWVDAEFPRDFNKNCRVKDDSGEWWEESDIFLVGYYQDNFIVLLKEQMITEEYSECQVRRDSVEGNKP